MEEVADEIEDVQLYLVRLADKLDFDILAGVEKKLVKNQMKHPKEKVRGSSRKYLEYQGNEK